MLLPVGGPPQALLMVICIFRILLCFGFVLPLSFANDVFCGKLQAYKQQWFNQQATAISSQSTSDLKQCLELCCKIPDCKAVTFMGVLEDKVGEPNCMLVTCDGVCQLNEKSVLTEGVVSVVILRDEQVSTVSSTPSESTSGHNSFTSHIFRSEFTPIWAVGLVIVVAVLCVGLNVGLISVYVCWRRQKARKQKAHISTINTLHAFNPS